MGGPSGFEFRRRPDGTVIITHGGHTAATLRGRRAESFLSKVDRLDPQDVMARFTGNYKRGNERRT